MRSRKHYISGNNIRNNIDMLLLIDIHNISSASFSVGNGTRQGSILSPCLFTRYLREPMQVWFSVSSVVMWEPGRYL